MNNIKTIANCKGRLEYLKILKSVLTLTGMKGAQKLVIKAEKLRINNEINYLNSEKEFNFNFISGGWNSIYAKTEDVAIKRACKKYNCKVSRVDIKTFRVATDEDTKNLMGLFY